MDRDNIKNIPKMNNVHIIGRHTLEFYGINIPITDLDIDEIWRQVMGPDYEKLWNYAEGNPYI